MVDGFGWRQRIAGHVGSGALGGDAGPGGLVGSRDAGQILVDLRQDNGRLHAAQAAGGAWLFPHLVQEAAGAVGKARCALLDGFERVLERDVAGDADIGIQCKVVDEMLWVNLAAAEKWVETWGQRTVVRA